ncbi:MAG: UPF0280 family protein [Burkholderiales bacterium]|nr:UPF0280 family protein [Burkholderiales bacterium]
MQPATCARLSDGRLHCQHGPITVFIEAWGDAGEIERAHAQAAARFRTILEELVRELPMLRTPVGEVKPIFEGDVARRMADAVWPHRPVFVTPMAAVAGAVADEVLAALIRDRSLTKAIVNNGGDIAFHLAAGSRLATGVVADIAAPALDAISAIDAASPVRGIATSGWRGRSHSLGIADAVTVLARTAADADAAATLVANAVNADHPAIVRAPAKSLREDSDLGDRLVTVDVPPLPPARVDAALAAGAACAEHMRARGLIECALLVLQGRARSVHRAAPLVRAA